MVISKKKQVFTLNLSKLSAVVILTQFYCHGGPHLSWRPQVPTSGLRHNRKKKGIVSNKMLTTEIIRSKNFDFF